MKYLTKNIKNWRKRQDERLRSKLESLSPKMRLVVIFALLTVFAICAFSTLGTALYRIGKNDGQQIEIEHIKQLDLHHKQDSINSYK
jgi:ribosomal protein L18